MQHRLAEAERALRGIESRFREITDDQIRQRANFERLPPTSAVYKRLLEKFDAQETEIESLGTAIKAKRAEEAARRKDVAEYVNGLSIDG